MRLPAVFWESHVVQRCELIRYVVNVMSKILIFGNSASGKSTLALQMAKTNQCDHLDLDTIAWQQTLPPKRTSLQACRKLIESFMHDKQRWIIEGCYTDLLDFATPFASQLIFLDLPIQACINNAKKRPWEPHKYASKEAQDANLAMLINWISDYENRLDTFSKKSHQELYSRFKGLKKRMTKNQSCVE